jgi:hypothetical protein
MLLLWHSLRLQQHLILVDSAFPGPLFAVTLFLCLFSRLLGFFGGLAHSSCSFFGSLFIRFLLLLSLFLLLLSLFLLLLGLFLLLLGYLFGSLEFSIS